MDDFFGIFLYTANNGLCDYERIFNSVSNIFDVLFQRTIEEKYLHGMKRKLSLSIRKLLGEGTPNEINRIFRWIINTRKISIHLPPEKSK